MVMDSVPHCGTISGCHRRRPCTKPTTATPTFAAPHTAPMELVQEFWFFITHLNITLPAFIGEHGNLVYALLFAIIFIETGLVIMPFLPGDSLLFVAGSLAEGGDVVYSGVGARVGGEDDAGIDHGGNAVGHGCSPWGFIGPSLAGSGTLKECAATGKRAAVPGIIHPSTRSRFC